MTSNRKKLFSVTIKDCKVDYFTVGGHGGSGKDTSNTGVRVTHEPSGAVGKAVDTRSQEKNRRLAFIRMANSDKFILWIKIEASRCMGKPTPDELVDKAMDRKNLKVEVKNTKNQWIEEKQS